MKIKNAVLCGILAACALLCGCSDNKTPSSDASSAEDSGQLSESSTADDTELITETPKEIEGFRGNTVDVQPKSGDLIAEFDIEGYGTIKAVLFPEAAPLGVENFQKLCDSGFYKGLNIHRVIGDFMFQGGSLNGDGTGGEALVNGGSFGIETAQNARHFYGALCYANAGGMNTTQFYIINNKKPQDISENTLAGFRSNVEQGLALGREAEHDDEAAYYISQAQYFQTILDWADNATDEIKERYKENGGYFALDGQYTVFGQVYEGFDVIDSISAVQTEDNGLGEKSKPVQEIVINDITVSTFEG